MPRRNLSQRSILLLLL